jgi:hypothetical protein
MLNPSSRKSSALPEVRLGLCSMGIQTLREACKTKVELETLEQRLLLSGVVADGRDPTVALVTTDGATTASASTGVDTGVTDMSSLVNTLLADYGAWTQALPTRTGWITKSGTRTQWTNADSAHTENRNEPQGSDSLYAINPGRVTWVYDPAATHSASGQTPWSSYYSSSYTGGIGYNGTGPYWWENTYTDQYVIDRMVAKGLMDLTGQTSVTAAWDALFKSFNQYHATGNKSGWESAPGYVAGEGISIKCNLNTEIDQAQTNNMKKNTPQVISAVLYWLTQPRNDPTNPGAGISQSDVFIYDDLKVWSKTYWDFYNASNTSDPHMWSPQTRFPSVHWMDCWDPTYANGRNASPMSANDKVYYPWNPGGASPVPQYVVDSKYAINMSVLSTHNDAGVTLSGKNYIGAIGSSPNNGGVNGTAHTYRQPASNALGTQSTQATFLANAYLGQKNILYLNDGLYGGWGWGNDASTPTPWSMRPFGNGQSGGTKGWPSSLLMSQDPIALDSVAWDFIWTESLTGQHTMNLGNTSASDNYLHEAANIGTPASLAGYLGLTNIPSWITGQGASASLGVHEHWNDANNKQYTRNLSSGTGIELSQITPASATPAAPSNLLFTVVSGSQVNLSWTDNSNNELGFKIERATNSGFTTGLTVLGTTNPDVHTFSDTTATAATSGYYYRVSAVNESLASSYATAGPVDTPTDTTPTAPAYLIAQVQSGNQVRLTWTLVNGSDRGIQIERATSSDFSTGLTLVTTTAAHATYYTDALTAAQAGVAYYYRIRATNGAGVSGNSNTAYAAIGALVSGVSADMYLFNWGTQGSGFPSPTQYAADLILPDFNNRLPSYLTPEVTLNPSQINYSTSSNAAWSGLNATLWVDRFATRFTGYINITQAGTYTFYLNSGDGSRMYLDGTQIINRNSTGTSETASSGIVLTTGYHPFTIEYFNNTSNNIAVLSYAATGIGINKQAIPSTALSYASNGSPQWAGSSSTDWATASNWAGGAVPTSSTEAILANSPYKDVTHTNGGYGLKNRPTLNANQAAFGLDIRSGGWTVDLNDYTLSLGVGGLQLYGGATPTSKVDLGTGNMIVEYSGTSPLKMIENWVKAGGGTKSNGARYDWNGTGGITSSDAALNNQYASIGIRDNGFALAARDPMTPVEGVTVPDKSVVVRYTWIGDMDLDGTVTVNDYLEWLYYYRFQPAPENISWMTGDFNYDGQINVNDYLMLLDGFRFQGTPQGSGETLASMTPAATTQTLVDQVAQAGGTQALATTDSTTATVDGAAATDLSVLQTADQGGTSSSPLAVTQTPENPDLLQV